MHVARGIGAAYTARALSVCPPLRTNDTPTSALERVLSVCGPSDFFGPSSSVAGDVFMEHHRTGVSICVIPNRVVQCI